MSNQTTEDAMRRAREAEERTDWVGAARHYEEALSTLADAGGGDEAAMLTALGRCYWNASEPRPAWRSLRRAISLFAERGDGAGQADATLEILRIWGPWERHQAMAEDALAAIGDAPSERRARLLGRIGREEDSLAMAEALGLWDVDPVRRRNEAWRLFGGGRADEAATILRDVHRAFAEARDYQAAAAMLREAGYHCTERGLLELGESLLSDGLAYARSVHLNFHIQLMLMDLAAIAFARGAYDRCLALVDEAPTDTDFRADLYRMWIAALSGDMDRAMALMPDPARSGGTDTAYSQLHGAAAGMLFDAGRREAAAQELQIWAEAGRAHSGPGDAKLAYESAALIDCILALGDDALLDAIEERFAGPDRTGMVFSTLQGRGLLYGRGAIALRRGRVEDAERHFSDGAALARRERCPIDEARCLEGLAEVAASRADSAAASAHRSSARALYERHNARLYLDRMART
ncbi:MAG: hypothetical protein HYX50_02055 [Chloroflexi bacterium]|nr:hypothetical protein [Chloroflexota bacterium]